jgi:hypothetical protein
MTRSISSEPFSGSGLTTSARLVVHLDSITQTSNNKKGSAMGLIKAPNILTFFIAFALVIAGALTKFDVSIPFVGLEGFWLLLVANCLFILGCITRGF